MGCSGATGDGESVVERFEAGPFADRAPAAVEAPFALVLAGQVVRGRIDAVFAQEDGTTTVVDWKTGRVPQGQELRTKQLQLAIYRLAFSRLYEIPLEQIEASFFYIDHGVDLPAENLPSEEELEEIITRAQKHFG